MTATETLISSLTEKQHRAVTAADRIVHISAGPGSGKTRTLAARIAHLIDEGVDPAGICALTFTRSACDEIRSRVAGQVGPVAESVTIETFHGAALALGPRDGLQVASAPEADAAVRSLISGPTRRPARDHGGISRIRRDLVHHEAQDGHPSTDAVAVVRERLMDAGLVPTWDLVPRLIRRGPARRYDHVLVDEVQDVTPGEAQMAALLLEPDGRLFLVGDGRQCIPEGQTVSTPNGPRPVEAIRVGEEVFASVGGGESPARVSGVTRTMQEEAYEFETETGSKFRATAGHVLFAALGEPDGHYVYLMHRRGYGFRIGVSSLGATRDTRNMWKVRAHGELADRMWILAHTEDPHEAHRLEHTLSYRYQVPMAPFRPRPDTMFRDAETAREWFSEFSGNGARVLKAFRQSSDCAPYVAKSSGSGRIAVNVVHGTKGGYSQVSVESSLVPELVAAEHEFRPGRRGTLHIRKCFRDARAAYRYASELAGDIEGEVVETLSVPSADRRVFAVRASGVFPTMLVPEVGPDGVVRLVRVVSRRKVPAHWCYDLEVPGGGNFIVGNVVVHNSIMGWRGADASVLPRVTHRLTRTFRFGSLVAEEANGLGVGDPITGDAGMLTSMVFRDLGIGDIGALCHRDRRPGWSTAILCRTHADCEAIAGLYPDCVRHVERDPRDGLSSAADRLAEATAGGMVPALTIHSAKGREWDQVIVVGPSTIQWGWASDDEEERRVLYVAVTRARRRLVLIGGIPEIDGWRIRADGLAGGGA